MTGRRRTRARVRREPYLDVAVPPQPARPPVVVLVHGGYWRRPYGPWLMRPLAADVVAHGWAAVRIGYRRLGGPGARGGWPATFDDVAAGLDALSRRDDTLDLERVVIVGHSAGGHLALWAAAADRIAPGVHVRCVVGIGAVTDLAGIAARRGRARAAALVAGLPPEDRWRVTSPIDMPVPPIPVVLVHGGRDRTVPLSTAHRYVEYVGAAGGDASIEVVPGDGHRAALSPHSSTWRAARRVVADALARPPTGAQARP